MHPSPRFYEVTNKTTQLLVLFYQALAVLVFIGGLYFSYGWLRNPFIGGFFEHTFVLNGTNTREPGKQWAMYEHGFKQGDQLISVNGTPITNSNDLRHILEASAVTQTVTVEMRTSDGQVKPVTITLRSFSATDRLAYFIMPMVLSLVFLIVSLWIFGLRRTEPAGRAFTVFASSLAITTGGLFDLYTSHYFTYLWVLAVSLAGGALVDLALGFPQEARLIIRRPYLRWVGYFIGLVLVLQAYGTHFDFAQPLAYINTWRNIYTFTGLSALFYFAALGYRAITAYSPVVKSQARTILLGALVSFVPVVGWLLYAAISPLIVSEPLQGFNPYLLPFLVIFPVANGYVIMRFRLLRTDYWVRQSIVYSILTIFVVAAYALFVVGISLLIPMQTNNPFLIGTLVFLIAVVLDPLRTRLQVWVDGTFFRGRRAYEDRIRTFTHQLTGALDLTTIGRVLRQQIESSLMPERLHIYTYDQLNDQYAALANGNNRPSTDIRFASGSSLVQYLQQERIPLYLDSINPPAILKADEARLSLLGARLFVALPGDARPVGWLALGSPLSGEAYTPKDLDFLDTLSDQASVAISRVQTVIDLERRVQEMNALTRVSQGVNVTLTFDDVLELIFAQTTQIIPSSYFHITLYNKAANYFYYAFRVDDQERLESLENQPLAVSFGLGPEIIRKGRPIITQDYSRECQARNLTPSAQNIYAWMGVPLNSGAETIGALSVGSPDPTVTYTRAQLDLLQAVADQTVGAIVQARLLQETEKRAYQLATLNEITRQITSTLEQEPLLKNILENAVSILNCEAGTLFLMDEQTGELEFRVTVGPVAGNLLGQRLPPGTGIVGRAVQIRAPVIENDAQRSLVRGIVSTDKQTGTPRSLLAVPMMIKDRVLGVIEVINRRDGLPFVADDQNILTAFAGQAAVAIENARLLALSDQELEARVEELQVMGRIVRELNASLEVDRTMRIALEWAIRRSSAEAGLIGVLEDERLRLMAHQGYEDVFADQTDAHLSLDFPSIRNAIESGQSRQVSLLVTGEKGILPGAHTQIIVPIRREAEVIGLIILESTSDSQGNLDFLNRLIDSAAIAISNAQLYAEIQRANQAKSEFVSFVAHELKNPMTSIKGYSELLAAGAVGQINENQTNFLNTIRANVQRMSTLVSDLNDNAKIEAGQLRLEYKPVQLDDVVDEVIRSTKRQIDEKKQTVELLLPDGLPDVWADQTRVAQVLTNLVSNAHKYTPDGGRVLVGAEATFNQWDPAGAKQVVHLWVKDNGIGISIEDQAKIFQRFFRSDDSKAREAPGTGLGLNITRSLVEMQGGRIWFDSEFRKGTTFHFTIPVAEG
ncbi:MAG TPA: GAF domain-containing protein [Anaerolineales bacterium]|nr:GAF domain-containing protein [Anaerolineales bacterium]